MNVLVTGGTGRLGRALVPLLSADGHSVRILSRVQRTGPDPDASHIVGDLATGAGLSRAVAGIDVIVHAASDSRNARTVDVEGTRRLVDVALAAGVKHLVYASIVGVDRRGSATPVPTWDCGRFRSIHLERLPRHFVPATTPAPMASAAR